MFGTGRNFLLGLLLGVSSRKGCAEVLLADEGVRYTLGLSSSQLLEEEVEAVEAVEAERSIE
jgi:hypothetical protein